MIKFTTKYKYINNLSIKQLHYSSLFIYIVYNKLILYLQISKILLNNNTYINISCTKNH